MSNVRLGPRVKFAEGKQNFFLEQALLNLDIEQSELAKISKVCGRTLRDWKREKYNIGLGSLEAICKKMKVNVPKNIRILPEYWNIPKAAKLGGRRYTELYGSPGTLESRRKGGINSQKKLRSNPELARKRALITRKEIEYPAKSSDLAEFIGIMLGDGGIVSNYQISISFNPKADLKYACHIQKLVTGLFGISSTVKIRKKWGSGDVIVGGINLVDFLVRCGIKKGNKIAQKIDIPQWIWSSEKYKIACLRGLVDTDGCFYRHKYIANGKRYTYLKMCFTSYSPPLLKSVTTILKNLELAPKNTAKNRVYLYSLPQIQEYFNTVGTSNPRYLNMYNNFVSAYK